MPSSKSKQRKTKKRGGRKTSKKKGLQTPGNAMKDRAKGRHFHRDGVETPKTALRDLMKKRVIKRGCELCGIGLVEPNGVLSRRARLDHCHKEEAPDGKGFIRGWLCASCNALEGCYKWTKVSNADERLASAIRRKHHVKISAKRISSFRKDPLKTKLKF